MINDVAEIAETVAIFEILAIYKTHLHYHYEYHYYYYDHYYYNYYYNLYYNYFFFDVYNVVDIYYDYYHYH